MGIVVMVPKKAECVTVKDYRAITLMNAVHKIFAKILRNRLKEVLDRGIDVRQFGVPGRSISVG